MRRTTRHLSYANVVSTLCLFIVLGGGAYAATQLPAKSVGTRQLKAQAVTGAKIKDGTITGAKVDSRTLGTVPKATEAELAAKATSAERASSAATADRANTAASADRATKADLATTATTAANAELLGGSPASGFVGSSQVGYIDRAFSGCSVSVICSSDVLTIAGVTVRAICENAAGPTGIILRVIGADRTGYGFVTNTTDARHGQFEGDGNVVTAIGTGSEFAGATGTIVMRTPLRIITLSFDARTRAPTVTTAACNVQATALAV